MTGPIVSDYCDPAPGREIVIVITGDGLGTRVSCSVPMHEMLARAESDRADQVEAVALTMLCAVAARRAQASATH